MQKQGAKKTNRFRKDLLIIIAFVFFLILLSPYGVLIRYLVWSPITVYKWKMANIQYKKLEKKLNSIPNVSVNGHYIDDEKDNKISVDISIRGKDHYDIENGKGRLLID